MSAAPMTVEYVPMAQFVQTDAPDCENVPAEHFAHVSRDVAPSAVEKDPGLHG